MHFDTGEALCEYVANIQEGQALLSFSCGKDSIGAYLQMKPYFHDIVPFFLYLVPGLSFVEESLAYYEDVLGRHIYRLPHPSLYRWLNTYTFQAPENIATIEYANLPIFDYEDSERVLREDLHLPPNLLTATGVRARDNLARWSSIKMYGPLVLNKQKFFPIFDWTKGKLLQEIERSGIKLPVDYHMFGRSFDGLDFRFMYPIRELYPEDYERILAYFPLAGAEIARQEYRAYPQKLKPYWKISEGDQQ